MTCICRFNMHNDMMDIELFEQYYFDEARVVKCFPWTRRKHIGVAGSGTKSAVSARYRQ